MRRNSAESNPFRCANTLKPFQIFLKPRKRRSRTYYVSAEHFRQSLSFLTVHRSFTGGNHLNVLALITFVWVGLDWTRVTHSKPLGTGRYINILAFRVLTYALLCDRPLTASSLHVHHAHQTLQSVITDSTTHHTVKPCKRYSCFITC